MTTANATDFYQNAFHDTVDLLPASGSLRVQRLRQSALARFAILGFPSSRDEDWKYTRLTSFERQQFRVIAEDDISLDDSVVQALAQHHDLPGYRLVFIDGYYAPHLSTGDSLPHGLSFNSIGWALSDEDTAVIEALEQADKSVDNGFEALNIAYLSDGVNLQVAENTIVAEPVNLVFINLGQVNSGAHVRNLLTLESGSQASVTETYIGLADNSYFSNSHTGVMLAENARLEFHTLQQQGQNAIHIAGLKVKQQADSHFGYHCFSLGGRLVRQDLEITLAAPGAECLVNALLLGQGRQHMDLHTRVDHSVPHCNSQEYVRGILDGRARGVLDGKITVRPQAQKTDARLVSKNLLLSRHAEMDVKPQLEIYADDVKCSHGTTVGELDDDALFYLRSRGLDETTARALMTYAFADDILGRVPSAALRSSLRQRLLAHLPQALHIKELL